MARNRTQVAIRFNGGIDTKSDAKVVLPTELLDLRNGEFTKGGSVRKRPGSVDIPPYTTSNTVITDALSLASLGGDFVLLGRTNAYAHDRVKNAWTSLGPYTSVNHKQTDVAVSSVQQTSPDLDTTNGVSAVAWADSRGGIRCTVFDDASGAAFVSEYELVSASAILPKVTAIGSNLLITWFDSANNAIKGRLVKTTDVLVSVATATFTIAEDAHSGTASHMYDIVAGDGVAYLAFRQDAAVADLARVFTLNSTGTVTRAVNATAGTLTVGPALAYDADNDVVYLATYAAGDVTLKKLDGSDLSELDTATYTPPASVLAMSVGVNALAGPSLWMSASGFASSLIGFRIARFDDGLTQVGTETLVTHGTVTSAGFWDGFNSYALVRYVGDDRTNLQNSYFLYRDDGVVVARMLYGSAPTTSFLVTGHPRPKAYGTDKFQVALPFQRQVRGNLDKVVGAGVKLTPIFGHTGVKRCVLDVAPQISTAEVGGVLYTSGGFLWAIDGSGNPVEAQFSMFPEMLAASHTAVAGGNLTASSAYNYRWYYEWTNARGQRVKSLALTSSVLTTGGNLKFDVVLQTLSHTRMQSRSPVAIVGYRTEANKSDFYYRVTDTNPVNNTGDNKYVANSVSTNTITFTDNLSDANLTQREVDYMSKGEVEHLAFDGPSIIALAQNRMFAVGGGQDPDSPQYSLQRTDGNPVESNDSFVVTEFPQEGGDVTAISYLNGMPIVFRERAVYALTGSGPFNNRYNPEPYKADRVSSDVGCVYPRSVVATGDGVFFQSVKGKYLLDPSGQVSYIGARAEAFNDQGVVGAVVVPDTNIVAFFTDEGRTVTYDYFYKSWGTNTGQECLAACAADQLAYLEADGTVQIRTEDTYTDGGRSYSLRFRTAPIHLLDSVQAFWRINRIQVLGEYVSPHELQVGVYYNRSEAPFQTIVWRPDDVLEQVAWGDGNWGDGLWGGDPNGSDYQFDEKLKRAKCSTVSFEFEDVPGESPGASYEITELVLDCAQRRGLSKLPATRKP